MKIFLSARHAQTGSVLLVSMLICAVIGTALASYLTLTQTQNMSVMRSQDWNRGISLTEAGIEEALTHINKSAPFFDPRDSTNNWASDSWTYANSRYNAPRRFFGNDYYDVSVRLSAGTPIINSTGQVYMASSYSYAPQALFAQVGGQVQSGGDYVGRRVRVQTKIDPLFAVAMAALREIDFNGKNVATDSFDSADPNYSVSGYYTNGSYAGGLYPTGDLSKTKANGDVVTDYTILNSLNVGNAKIKGVVKTGPNGTISIGPNGSVGDRAWVEGGNKGIQPGRSADDMNVAFPSVTLPTGATWLSVSPSVQTIDGIQYDYVFNTSGDYTISTFTKGIFIGTNVSVRLKVTDNVSMNGNSDTIRLALGANLKLYMQGTSFKIAGNGVLNDNNNAANFYYYGLPTNTSVDFAGNASFTGAVYAPNADFRLGGGGNNTYDFVGASVSRTVQMNGHFNFHYDENLKKVGPSRGWIPSNWTERAAGT